MSAEIVHPSRIVELETQLEDIDTQLITLKQQTLDLETKRNSVQRALQCELQRTKASLQFPFEILAQIFYFAVKKDSKFIPNILLVCRTWHDVAIGYPQLWTSINFEGPYHRNRLDGYKQHLNDCYERSGTLPLDIVFTTNNLYKATEECLLADEAMGAVEVSGNPIPQGQRCSHLWPKCPYWRAQSRTAIELFSAILEHGSSRWRSFHFEWPSSVALDSMQSPYFDSTVLDSVTTQGNLLEELYIGNSGGEFLTTIRLDANLANLRRIELIDQCWDSGDADSQPLWSVRELSMEWKDEGTWNRRARRQLGVNWMKIFPGLQDLTLRSRSSSWRSQITPTVQSTPDTEEYPAMKRLSLVGYIPVQILQNLNFPNLKTLVMEPNADGGSLLVRRSYLCSLSVATNTKSLELRGPFKGPEFYLSLHTLLVSLQQLKQVVASPQTWENMKLECPILKEDSINSRNTSYVIDHSLDRFRSLVKMLGRDLERFPNSSS